MSGGIGTGLPSAPLPGADAGNAAPAANDLAAAYAAYLACGLAQKITYRPLSGSPRIVMAIVAHGSPDDWESEDGTVREARLRVLSFGAAGIVDLQPGDGFTIALTAWEVQGGLKKSATGLEWLARLSKRST